MAAGNWVRRLSDSTILVRLGRVGRSRILPICEYQTEMPLRKRAKLQMTSDIAKHS